MNRNIIIITIISLGVITFGIIMTVFGIINVSNITLERSFPSAILGEERDIIIYTPPAYSLKLNQRYPVLYVLDGQNYFKERKEERRAEWSMQKTLDRLMKEGQIQEMIVVGIYASDKRLDEYTTAVEGEHGGEARIAEFSSFLTEELKPFIDRRYRTYTDAEHTGIMGASLSGFTSLYIGWNEAEVFSKIGSLSPYLWWENYTILSIMQADNSRNKEVQIWLDAGESYDPIPTSVSEEELVKDVHNLKEILVLNGYTEKEIYFHQQEQKEDPAQDLDKRLESLLLFLFPN